jgi:hypothetical protein
MALELTAADAAAFGFAYEGYKVSDEADKTGDATIRYFGFLNRRGEWFIMRQDVAGTTIDYRFVKGDSAYTTAWAARESQTYDYFNAIFK